MKKGNKQQCMGVSDFKHWVTLEIPVWCDDGSHLAPSASHSAETCCPHSSEHQHFVKQQLEKIMMIIDAQLSCGKGRMF